MKSRASVAVAVSLFTAGLFVPAAGAVLGDLGTTGDSTAHTADTTVSADSGGASGPQTVVFAAEGNRLRAYDAATGDMQVVIPAVVDDPHFGRDINGQTCFQEIDGDTFFITGEDSGQDEIDPVTGEPIGSPGWGWFELEGDTFGELSAVQLGKLRPTWSPHTADDDSENFGCGFLPDGRLATSDVGDQLPHEAPSGQLLVWFPDEDGGFADNTIPGGPWTNIDNSVKDNYCKIDTTIGTAGGLSVHGDWVYVASNRPGPNGPSGIYRYDWTEFPADNNCEGFGTEADLVDEGVVTRELWLPLDPFVLTPSMAVPSGRELSGFPTWYVSSVFTGVIAEYVDLGPVRFRLRNVMEPPGGLPTGQASFLPGNDGGTPFGLAVTPEGSLWYADLGIVGPGPAGGEGSVQRITFDSAGEPIRHVIQDGLNFADGLGVLQLPAPTASKPGGGGPPGSDKNASSESTCDTWSMYGRGAARTFAVPDDCESPIAPTTAATLRPTWVFKTEKTVTASPAVASGKVFVGDWTPRFYALDAETGEVEWTFDVPDSPGAAFGPIVSSAAVTRVKEHTPPGPPVFHDVVIFGAGPRVFALDAHDGSVFWVHVLDDTPGTPVQVESSPAVFKGVVYVGMDNHNTPGTGVRGGLLALDAVTGEELWKFEPELDHGDFGCGGMWSSPTLDVGGDGDRPLVFLGTANCPNAAFEWTPHTEAVTALDAWTGSPIWSFQPHPVNNKDHDFGATPNLFVDAEGSTVLGAGNKDGVYYALDPRTGDLLWQTKVAEPGDVSDGFSIGGFIGSPAAYGGRVFGGTAIGGPPYYHALDGTDGAIAWRGAQAPSYAASAAVNGVVFSGSLDNVLRAYHADTGAVLWAQPLLGPISSGPAIVGDTVFIGSGTSSSDACAGNMGFFSDLCFFLFEEALGATGGVHAFTLATSALP